MRERRILITFLLAIILITLPYIAAFAGQGDDHIFAGFLVNPFDGNSYLAKMMEGFQGRWSFTLPFTQYPGEGEYIFLFYLFLGHLARITGIPLILTFHVSRILAFIFLFLVCIQFLQQYFQFKKEEISLTLLFVILGSGLGWLLTPFGVKTSDLWVAEAFPFLASFQNPHFPFGLGLMILILLLFFRFHTKISLFVLIISGITLAVVLPFGAVVIGSVIFIEQIWSLFRKKNFQSYKLLLLAISTLPFVAYQYCVVYTSPELAIWNSQNLTPSPPIWDFVISFSPALILAGLSIARRPKNPDSDLLAVLITWLILGAVIIYLPIGIQRRFMVGYFFPVSVLACTFLFSFSERRTRILGFSALLASTSLTLLIVLLAASTAIGIRHPMLYLSGPETKAIQWFNKNIKPGALILADTRMGMFLPGRTMSRVIYGHPFETLNANENRDSVEKFFNCQFLENEASEFLKQSQVSYLLASNVNIKNCYSVIEKNTDIVFRAGNTTNFVEIFQLK